MYFIQWLVNAGCRNRLWRKTWNLGFPLSWVSALNTAVESSAYLLSLWPTESLILYGKCYLHNRIGCGWYLGHALKKCETWVWTLLEEGIKISTPVLWVSALLTCVLDKIEIPPTFFQHTQQSLLFCEKIGTYTVICSVHECWLRSPRKHKVEEALFVDLERV